MQRFIVLACVIIFTLQAAGCGPIYQTDYRFIPPESQVGRNCAANCDNSRYQCLQLEDLQKANCERYAQQEARLCEDRIRYDEDRKVKWYECAPESCSSDTERCEAMYRSCYESCGGRVEAFTRCVANCTVPQPAPSSGPAGAERR